MRTIHGWKRALGIAALVALARTRTAAAATALTPVPNANPKTAGFSSASVLSPELLQTIVAQGSMALENGSDTFPYYGYDGDGPMLPLPGDVQTTTHNIEATKTEPDKNTYLVLKGLHGADPTYDYGTHFLFQGHELGVKDPNTGSGMGYITRINLDADAAHRVTLLASNDKDGKPLPTIDGSTWDPWAERLLFTTESKSLGSVFQATPDLPSTVEDLSGAMGRGGYEGIQNDSAGNLWIVEDVGGSTGTANSHAKQPNSFVYRFVPQDRSDLTKGGKLQVLQVMSLANPGQPIVFHAGAVDADILADDVRDLHTYHQTFATNWVTIHDTAVDGFSPFDANALAKAGQGTPLKRPENGQFRPGSSFREFVFDETGDTNAMTEAGADFGGFGGVFKLSQKSPSDDSGTLTLVYKGDVAHTGFDNCGFWSKDEIVFVEDAGDGLHSQRNALDSAYLVDLDVDYGAPGAPPLLRILAEGRDPSATLDSGLGSISGTGFQNEGDNEITGFHVSNGDPRPVGILGGLVPNPFLNGWRVFYTQQHGDNETWEIRRAR
jgi:hypothetical protein